MGRAYSPQPLVLSSLLSLDPRVRIEILRMKHWETAERNDIKTCDTVSTRDNGPTEMKTTSTTANAPPRTAPFWGE